MPVTIYTPNPVIIPEDLPYSRQVFSNFNLVTGGEIEDLSQYDFKTVFYDVFFPCNSKRLWALGPPMLNLVRELSFRVIYRGNELAYHLEHFQKWSILKFHQEIDEEEVDLLFDFKIFTQNVRIKKEVFPKSNLAMACVQKNSNPKWVRSWYEWYTRLYNATIILYDNDSDNFAAILDAIKDFNPMVVKWDFKFGSYTAPAYNRFCEVSALNHFFFTSNCRFGMHFDVDEFLISKVDLWDFVNSHEKVSLFLLDSYYIPDLREGKKECGIEDFYSRPKMPRRLNFKYIYRRDHVQHLHVHDAVLLKGRALSVSPDIMYFNHYKSLNTRWQLWSPYSQIMHSEEDLVPDIEARKRIDRLSQA